MLKMRVYSERTVNLHGLTSRVGEDALPFVNGAGMFAADGMGGSAGIRVIHFDPIVRDPEAFADRLMDYFEMQDKSQETRDRFREYVRESLSSLLDPVMETFYQAPGKYSSRLKKSGYFGSHALGIVMTEILLHLEEALPVSSYESWKSFCEQLKTVPLLQAYRDVIGLFGTECAKASLNKIDYYATTLSAAFFWEREDEVEVFLINCGDSRTYVWDADGFRQAAEDQGRNGGMTANFSFMDDERVRPSFEYRTYKKPCMLFSVSDGVYATFPGRNGFHSIPMRLEAFLMTYLSKASSMEEAEAALKELFDQFGGIDDSNSMAGAAFGFESYEEIRRAAKEHLEALTDRYHLDDMPDDFLLTDYEQLLIRMEQEASGELAPLLELAYGLAPIHSYCASCVENKKFSGTYLKDLPGLNDEQRRLEGENARIREELMEIAADNFFDFVDTSRTSPDFFRSALSFIPMLSPADKKAVESGKAYMEAVRRRQAQLKEAVRIMEKIAADVRDNIGPLMFDGSEVWDTERERAAEIGIDSLIRMILMASKGAESRLTMAGEQSGDMSRFLARWKKANRDLMAEHLKNRGRETAEFLVDTWLKRGTDPEEVLVETTIPAVRISILSLIARYRENEEKYMELEEKKARVREEGAHAYWQDMGAHDIEIFLENEEFFEEDPGLRIQITEMRNQNEELVKMRALVRQQKEFFASYLADHLREVSQDKRDDVARNGWM